MSLAAELDPASLIVVIDSREQLPFSFEPMQSVVGTLSQGDYSLRGMEHICAVERKSLQDLVSCFGGERERFERELQRLAGLPHRCVICEGTWHELEAGEWRSKVTGQQAVGSVLSWMSRYAIPFIFAGSRDFAQSACKRFLFLAARSRWQEARHLVGEVKRRKGAPRVDDSI